jgi:multicomponent K+:H+ antiporter subunit E
MKRVPWLLTLGLTVMWLLLVQSLSPGQVLLGIGVSILMTLGFQAVRPLHPHVRRPLAVLRLTGRAVLDILRSNLAVARIVLGLNGRRAVQSGFVEIPLMIRDPHALAVLAAIMTATPGTVWADLSPDDTVLTIHVLDLRDPQAVRDLVKHRYEELLQEIFE